MIGKQVLHYKIVEKLGEGGMGVVYRAEDTKLHRDVALKFLPDDALENDVDRRRFIAEARAAAALDHANICTVHEINETDGHHFIAMAYIDGQDIKDMIESGGPLPVLEVARIGAQVAEGLAAAHEKGIVHRDIKSANVMLTGRGRAKIMDFGLAQRSIGGGVAQDSATSGTIAYASPEQVSGEAVDRRGDIWSFGVMLYEMLTGKLPFGGAFESAIVYSILNETPAPASSLRDGVPEEFDRIIARALSRNLGERYQDMEEMRDDLVRLRNSIDPTISSAAGAGASSPVSSSPWRRVVIASAVWLGVSWVLARLVGLVVGNMQLSPHLVTMTTVGLLALLPAVILLAWFAGRRPGGAWGSPEKIGIPVNVVAAIALLFVMFSGKDLGAAMERVEVTNEEGETVERVIPKGSFRKNFAMYMFENESGDEELDWMQYAMPLLLEYDIFQDVFINIRSAYDGNNVERLREAGFDSWVGVPDGLRRKIASEHHQTQYVTGTINKEGDNYAIAVRVRETKSGKLTQEQVYRGSDIFEMTDEIAVDLKHATGVPGWHLDGVQDQPVANMVTDSPEAIREYALALKSMVFDEDWPATLEHLDAALAFDSTNALAHFHRWLAARSVNDAAAAATALQASLRHAYKVPERFQFIIKGNYYFQQQEPDKALALFEMMSELYPEDIQAYQALGQIYTLRNEIDNAIAAYERVIDLDPYQHDHLHSIAGLCKRRGYYDRAFGYLEQYAEANPQDPRSFEELAELHRDMGDFELARKNLDKALLIAPERVTLLIGAADADRHMGKFDEAFEQLRNTLRVCRSATDSARVYNALENYCEMRGEFRSAIDFLKKRQEKINPPLMRILQELDAVDRYIHAGNPDEAFAAMSRIEEVLTAPPFNLAVPYGYVEIYQALEKPDELEQAIEGFEAYVEALKLETMRSDIDYARGRVAEMRGEYETAIEFYGKIVEQNPGSSRSYWRLGRCQRELGRTDEAMASLQRSVKLRPFSGSANFELALLYHSRGDMKNARKHLDRSLAVWANADPAYEAAAQARATRDEWDAAGSM